MKALLRLSLCSTDPDPKILFTKKSRNSSFLCKVISQWKTIVAACRVLVVAQTGTDLDHALSVPGVGLVQVADLGRQRDLARALAQLAAPPRLLRGGELAHVLHTGRHAPNIL